jgi:hypothetical protein
MNDNVQASGKTLIKKFSRAKKFALVSSSYLRDSLHPISAI